MGSNREKSNITIAILENLVRHLKLFRIFGDTNNNFVACIMKIGWNKYINYIAKDILLASINHRKLVMGI